MGNSKMPCPMLKRIYTLFLVLVTASLANGLQFKMHPRMFQGSGRNITLSCSTTDEGPVKYLSKIQIKKMSLMGTWVDLATLNSDGNLDSALGQAIAIGYMGNVLQSYLNITWPWVSLQILGKYRCDSIGFTEREDPTNETVEVVVGGMAEMSSGHPPVPMAAKGMEERLSNLINSSFSNLSSALDSRFEMLQPQKCGAVTNDKKVESTQWPEGHFALPMADSGCPLNPPAWNKGLKKMNTGNHAEEHKHGLYSLPLHLQILKTPKGLLYQQFCSLQSSPARKRSWPAGSYCINYQTKSCPAGFISSLFNPGHKGPGVGKSLEVGKKDSDKLEKYELYSSPAVGFCCRHDGDPNMPIILPVSKPFYLYRHQGTCQAVKDMEVTQDSLMVERAINANMNFSELFPSHDAAYIPDFSVSPVKKELCYYSTPNQKSTPDLDGISNLNVFIRKEPQPKSNNLIHIEDQEESTEGSQLATKLASQLPLTINNPSVPFSMLVEGMMVPGRKIFVSGTPTNRRKRFNFFIGDSDRLFLALYVDFNLYLNNVVASYRDSCVWSPHKVVNNNPFRQGERFSLIVTMEEDRFTISVDEIPIIESKIRPDMKQSWLTHLYIEHEVQLDVVEIY